MLHAYLKLSGRHLNRESIIELTDDDGISITDGTR